MLTSLLNKNDQKDQFGGKPWNWWYEYHLYYLPQLLISLELNNAAMVNHENTKQITGFK